MKKLMILAGAALVALVACNKSETVVKESQSEITFKVVSQPTTKADPELTGTSLGTDNAYVIYASASSKTNAKYFTDQLFSYITASTSWEASSAAGTAAPIYWPFGGEKVDFLAYALKPAAKTALSPAFNGTTSAQDFTITSWDTYANQYDVMYAVKNAQTSTTNGGVVAMEFEHAQALLSFTAVASIASEVTINSITVKGLETVGTLKVDNEKTILDASWTLTAGADKTIKNISSFSVPITTPGHVGDNLLIPEQEAKTIVVNYTISGNTQDYELSIPRTTWKMGYKYVYALAFSLTEIVVTPTVVDWKTGTPVTIDTIE